MTNQFNGSNQEAGQTDPQNQVYSDFITGDKVGYDNVSSFSGVAIGRGVQDVLTTAQMSMPTPDSNLEAAGTARGLAGDPRTALDQAIDNAQVSKEGIQDVMKERVNQIDREINKEMVQKEGMADLPAVQEALSELQKYVQDEHLPEVNDCLKRWLTEGEAAPLSIRILAKKLLA